MILGDLPLSTCANLAPHAGYEVGSWKLWELFYATFFSYVTLPWKPEISDAVRYNPLTTKTQHTFRPFPARILACGEDLFARNPQTRPVSRCRVFVSGADLFPRCGRQWARRNTKHKEKDKKFPDAKKKLRGAFHGCHVPTSGDSSHFQRKQILGWMRQSAGAALMCLFFFFPFA